MSPRDSTTSAPFSSEAELSSTAASSNGGDGDNDDEDDGEYEDDVTKRMESGGGGEYQLPVQQQQQQLRAFLYSDSDYSDPYELSGRWKQHLGQSADSAAS